MIRSLRSMPALLAALALAVALPACGDAADDGGSNGGNAGAPSNGKLIEKDPANAGKAIKIGSKNFAEQFIVAEIYARALKAAGFRATTELNLGTEQVAYKALRGGDIDAYPEYTGTALTSFFRVKTVDVPRDPGTAYEETRRRLARVGVDAFAPTPFQNTYVVVSSKASAEGWGNPKTVSQLAAEVGDGVELSGTPTCRNRIDCYVGLQRTYRWKPTYVSSDGGFEDIDSEQADLALGFSTDGALSLTDKYATYEDDKRLFPPYNLTLLVRQAVASRLGSKGREVVERIQEPLTEEVMRELNSRVAIDKEEPDAVAAAYLREAGFVR